MENDTTARKICIFCWRTQDEVGFSEEHIIPDSIGGQLTLINNVCIDCNKWLGHNVDHHILRVPDILAAQKVLGETARFARTVKYNYDEKLISESGAEFCARTGGPKLELLTQKHPVLGNMIYPRGVGTEALRKNLGRRRRHLRLDGLKVTEEIERICRWANVAVPPHAEIHSDVLDIGYLRVTEKLQSRRKPKSQARLKPLIAKIAYEFIFLVGYTRFFRVADLPERLLKAMTTPEDRDGIHVARIKSPFEQPQPFHFIRFYRCGGYPRVDVGFYGTVVHMLFAPVILPENFFSDISERCGLPDVVGVHYEESTTDQSQALWALGENGAAKPLGGPAHGPST